MSSRSLVERLVSLRAELADAETRYAGSEIGPLVIRNLKRDLFSLECRIADCRK